MGEVGNSGAYRASTGITGSSYQERIPWFGAGGQNYYGIPAIDPFSLHYLAGGRSIASTPVVTSSLSPAPYVPFPTPWTARPMSTRRLDGSSTQSQPYAKRYSISQDPFGSPSLDSPTAYEDEDAFHRSKRTKVDLDNTGYWNPPLEHPYDSITGEMSLVRPASSFATPLGSTTSHDTADESTVQLNEQPTPSDLAVAYVKPPAVAFSKPPASGTSTLSTQSSVFDHGPFEPSQEEELLATTNRAKDALTTWYSRLNDLYHYKIAHGDTRVPQKYPENPALGIWVNKQRMEKKLMDENKKTTMTIWKLKALDEIGFDWGTRKGQHSWDSKYNDLCEYKKLNHNEDPPTKYPSNPALGRWVSTQRAQYKEYRAGKKTLLTKKRVQMLNSVGFSWTKMEDTNVEESNWGSSSRSRRSRR